MDSFDLKKQVTVTDEQSLPSPVLATPACLNIKGLT